MIEFLLAHQAALQGWVMLGVLAAIALWESFRPLRDVAMPTGARWLTNLALAAVGSVLVRVTVPVLGVGVALLAAERGWGLLNVAALSPWLSFAIAVVAIDLAQYGLHRSFHAVPLLWRIHKIHHSDLDVDCVTAVRHHPLEYLAAAVADAVVIVALGAPPLAVLVANLLVTGVSIFNHGNVPLAAKVDRALRTLIVTPDMHRIHHSIEDRECNANYAMVFAWWDRLFGTYCSVPHADRRTMPFGLAEARTAHQLTFVRLLALPFDRTQLPARAIARRMR